MVNMTKVWVNTNTTAAERWYSSTGDCRNLNRAEHLPEHSHVYVGGAALHVLAKWCPADAFVE